MDTKKQFILITGASSGIGKGIAKDLSCKYNVILHGRNTERLAETSKSCSGNNEQLIFTEDLSDINQLETSLANFITTNNIEITAFIHCAGFMKMLPLKMVTSESINNTFSTNIFSATIISKVLTSRKVNGTALKSIVFISSNISNFGAKAFSVYAASKGALDSLMRSLAIELAPRIRVNSVLPGAIPTEMTKAIFEDEEKVARMAATYPLGLGKVEDLFGIVEFLLSDKSGWITGQQITVDGGRTIDISG